VKFGIEFGFQGGLGLGSGSISLANIIYNMDTFNTTAADTRTIDNAGSDGTVSDGDMYSSNHINLGATQSVPYDTVDTGDYCYYDVATKTPVKFTASASTVNISTPTHHSNFFALKAGMAVEAIDLTYLHSNPAAIARLKDGETVAGLSFDLSDIYSWYPCQEGMLSGNDKVYDEVNNTFATIANATDSCKEALENTNYGLSKLLITQNATTGRWTGMADDNLIEFTGDERYVDTGWVADLSTTFSYEIIHYKENNGEYDLSGVFGKLYAGSNTATNGVLMKVGDKSASIASSEGIHHLLATYNALSKEVNFYLDSVLKSTQTVGSFTNSLSFLLGDVNGGNTELSNPLGLFKVHKNKVLTQDEVTDAYTKAKLIYPTLP